MQDQTTTKPIGKKNSLMTFTNHYETLGREELKSQFNEIVPWKAITYGQLTSQ